MEKINIAELLKDCPQGMELDCTMFDDVVFERIDSNFPERYIILRRLKSNTPFYVFEYGQAHNTEDAKCVIFPKGKTTWEGFVPPCKFKDGDIVATRKGDYVFLLKKAISYGRNNICYGRCYFGVGMKTELFLDKEENWYFTRLATENEKQKLFDCIKAKGYKWNAETKTLEKLIEPKFKVGDRIRLKNGGSIIEVTSINNDSSICVNDMSWTIKIREQDHYELVPNKFDITTLKPFDKVLIRSNVGQRWTHDVFGFTDKDKGFPFVCVGHYASQCIPYEGNEHLLGTVNDCDEYYKTWE